MSECFQYAVVYTVLVSVFGNGDEYDGPHPIPVTYKQIDDYELILKLVEEKVTSTIGALRAYVRTRSTAAPTSSFTL